MNDLIERLRNFENSDELGNGDFSLLHEAAAALEAAREDAERWREVERQATKKTAYDRYGNGAYWSVGLFSDDSRQTFGEAVDAAMQRTTDREGER